MKSISKQLMVWAVALAMIIGAGFASGWNGSLSGAQQMASADPCDPEDDEESNDPNQPEENMPSAIT